MKGRGRMQDIVLMFLASFATVVVCTCGPVVRQKNGFLMNRDIGRFTTILYQVLAVFRFM